VVAERFFDEAGGMQLILHAPFGSRINRTWGLALRKRFCRSFNFELQAAATENGILISLSDQHSFPLDSIFSFLSSKTVREVLIQALLAAPLFGTRWRWNVARSLAVLRFSKGRKVPPQIQRIRSDDLLASVFPEQAACLENIQGDIVIPDHPLVFETVRDCVNEAMDIENLIEILGVSKTARFSVWRRTPASPRPSAMRSSTPIPTPSWMMRPWKSVGLGPFRRVGPYPAKPRNSASWIKMQSNRSATRFGPGWTTLMNSTTPF
jgi:ATP-dependent Lhr-like helicase